MGQAAMGDAFAWLAQLTGRPLHEMAEEARALPPSSTGALALDWVNGCRSPHNDNSLQGVVSGLTMGTSPGELYQGTADGLACGGRAIVEQFLRAEVPIDNVRGSSLQPMNLQLSCAATNALGCLDAWPAGCDEPAAPYLNLLLLCTALLCRWWRQEGCRTRRRS
jgi:ribulose kinase